MVITERLFCKHELGKVWELAESLRYWHGDTVRCNVRKDVAGFYAVSVVVNAR